jgi:hypothetical protein
LLETFQERQAAGNAQAWTMSTLRMLQMLAVLMQVEDQYRPLLEDVLLLLSRHRSQYLREAVSVSSIVPAK